MTKITGTIPKQVTYFYSDSVYKSPGCIWNLDFLSKKNIEKQLVIPSAAADSLDAKSIAYAKNNFPKYKNINVLSKTLDNNPIKIKFFSASNAQYNNIKILVENHQLSIDTDIVLDTLLNCKIDNGIPDAEFVWANIQSKLHLIRVGSDLYHSIIDYQKKIDLPLIKKNNFELGGIYQTKTRMRSIFLGYVNTTQFKSSVNKEKFAFIHKKINKGMLFCNISSHEDPKLVLTDSFIENDSYRFSVRETHKFIDKIGTVSVPEDILLKIRKINTDRVKKYTYDYCSRNSQKNKFSIMSHSYLEYTIGIFSKLIHLYRPTESPPPLFDVKKYLLFA